MMNMTREEKKQLFLEGITILFMAGMFYAMFWIAYAMEAFEWANQ